MNFYMHFSTRPFISQTADEITGVKVISNKLAIHRKALKFFWPTERWQMISKLFLRKWKDCKKNQMRKKKRQGSIKLSANLSQVTYQLLST